MTTYQLPLVRHGFCRLCTITRLSAADTDGVCLFCREDGMIIKPRGARGPAPVQRCVKCAAPALERRSLCRTHQNEYTRNYRAQRRDANTRSVGRPSAG